MNKKQKAELIIFQNLHNSKDNQGQGEFEIIDLELKKIGIEKEERENILKGHYYLSPGNIMKSQRLFGVLTILMMLSLSALRFGNDVNIIVFFIILGMFISIPFFVFYFLFKKTYKINNILILAFISFIYSLFIGILFIIFSISQMIIGITFFPIMLWIVYVLELRKLYILFNKLKEIGNEK